MSETGKIVQVIGPVVDIRFTSDHLPAIRNAIHITFQDGKQMTVEVAQHIGDDIVRCIAMSSTDGLVRGMDCVDTGAPITVPVGEEVLGRMFNVLGEPIDGLGHFIHTYVCDGNPIPTFQGEPERIAVCDDIDEETDRLWKSLNEQNKISLYVRYVDLKTGAAENRLVNKNV